MRESEMMKMIRSAKKFEAMKNEDKRRTNRALLNERFPKRTTNLRRTGCGAELQT